VGKATHKTLSQAVIEQSENATIDKKYILCIDIFHIGGLTFLLSVSRHLKMCMVTY